MEYNSFVLQGIKSDAEMKWQMEIIPKSLNFLSCVKVRNCQKSYFHLGKKTKNKQKLKVMFMSIKQQHLKYSQIDMTKKLTSKNQKYQNKNS